MKKRDLWIILGVAVCAVALFLGTKLIKQPTRTGVNLVTEAPTASEEPAAMEKQADAEATTVPETTATSAPAATAVPEAAATAVPVAAAETAKSEAVATAAPVAAASATAAPETAATSATAAPTAASAAKKTTNSLLLAPPGLTVEMDAELEKAGGKSLWLLTNSAQGFQTSALSTYGMADAQSYLVIWMANYYFRAVPLLEGYAGKIVTVKNANTNGENAIVLGDNLFNMHKASCPDQICLTEGEVSLENRESRVLQSYIICLPNNLNVELVSADELLNMLRMSVEIG